MRISSITKPGLAIAAASLLSLAGIGAAQAAPAATTITDGHVDAVVIKCDSSGNITLKGVIGEDPGTEFPAANIGNYVFQYDRDLNTTLPAAFKWTSPNWVSSNNHAYEDDIPFIGFHYLSAASDECPASVFIDAEKVSGATNTGTAAFVAKKSASGSTSSASGNTSKVKVVNPNTTTDDELVHVHGSWKFGGTGGSMGTSGIGNYTIKFTVTAPGYSGTVSPLKIKVD